MTAKEPRQKRVLLVASGGGHWVQMTRLRTAFEHFDSKYVTTISGTRAPTGTRPVTIVTDGSKSSPHRLPVLFWQLIVVFLTFRPDIVITTGAAPGLVALQIGKMVGCRTVWIDSMANSEEMSLSGRMARRFADLWLTQWPHLLPKYPDLEYCGAVF